MPIAPLLAYIIITIYAIAFTITIRARLSKFSQIFGYFALTFLVAAVALFQYSHANWIGPTKLYFDIKNAEFNYYATFSSMLLFTSFVMSSIIAFATQPRRWWHISLWLYVASLFLFLAFDEYFQIHEGFYYWKYAYMGVAGFSSLLLLVVFWKAYPKKQLIAWLIIVGGMGTAAVGGLGLERFVAKACFGIIQPYTDCVSLPLLEEVLEALGYGTTAIGMLLFAEHSLQSKRWNNLKRIAVLGMGFWILLSIFAYWLQPALENRLLATPVYANFADSQMVLVGYRLDKDHLTPADELNVTLYWRADIIPSRQYGYTVNLINPVTGESIARVNTKIIDPTTNAWFAGSTHRTELAIPIPADVETPVSPLLLVTLWREKDDGTIVLNPDETDNATFGEGSPIIAQIPILSANTTGDKSALYRFDNGARLLAYTVDSADLSDITVTFQWSTAQPIGTQLSQMLHFVHENDTDRLIFDQPPFQGSFPLTSWVNGMRETATWHVTIPDDALAGTYTIYTGLYDSAGVRVGVTNQEGNPVPENAIVIGEITIGDD